MEVKEERTYKNVVLEALHDQLSEETEGIALSIVLDIILVNMDFNPNDSKLKKFYEKKL